MYRKRMVQQKWMDGCSLGLGLSINGAAGCMELSRPVRCMPIDVPVIFFHTDLSRTDVLGLYFADVKSNPVLREAIPNKYQMSNVKS